MGPNALSSLADGHRTDTSPVVLSRENGTWSAATSRFAEEIRELAAALSAYGLPPNHGAAILGAGGCDGLRAALGVLTAGGMLVVLDPSIGDDALRRVLVSTGAVQAIAPMNGSSRASWRFDRPPRWSWCCSWRLHPPSASRGDARDGFQVGAARLRDDPGCLANPGRMPPTPRLSVGRSGEGPRHRARKFPTPAGRSRRPRSRRGVTVLIALPIAGIERDEGCRGEPRASILLSDPSERPTRPVTRRRRDPLTAAGLERLHRA
jgi:hypothetical protein